MKTTEIIKDIWGKFSEEQKSRMNPFFADAVRMAELLERAEWFFNSSISYDRINPKIALDWLSDFDAFQNQKGSAVPVTFPVEE